MSVIKFVPLRMKILASLSVLLLVAVLAFLAISAHESRAVHTSTSTSDERVVSVSDIDFVRQKYSTFESQGVSDYLPTVYGILLRLDDGIVALGGDDWSEQWRYTRREAVESVNVAPRGRRVHLTYEAAPYPWSDGIGVSLDTFSGSLDFEYSLEDVMSDSEEADEAELIFAYSFLFSIRRDGSDAVIAYYDLENREPMSEVRLSDFCLSDSLMPDRGWNADPTFRGVVLTFQCASNNDENKAGPQVMAHLDVEEDRENWRRKWSVDDESVPLPEVYYMSDESVPQAQGGLLEEVLRGGDQDYSFVTHNAGGGSHSDYWLPSFLDDEVIGEEFRTPLSDESDRPDVMIMGVGSELEVQVAIQASRILAEDPYFPVSESDLSLFDFRRDGNTVESVSYRDWDRPNYIIAQIYRSDVREAVWRAGEE